MKPAATANYRTIALRLSRLTTPLPSLASSNHQVTTLFQKRCLASSSIEHNSSIAAAARTANKAGCNFSTAVMEDEFSDEEESYDQAQGFQASLHNNVWSNRRKASSSSSHQNVFSTKAKSVNSQVHVNHYQQPQNQPLSQVNEETAAADVSHPQQQLAECTCGFQKQQDILKDTHEPLPPPLPKPVYSVHKRILPSNLTALSSSQGRKYLLESMSQGTAESYFNLTEQFVNQSDPAFCGVTTLLMVLNAMNIDPNVRWKGGWRFYGDEDVLLQRCCLNAERIRRVGITMEQFMVLGTCHGMHITMKRPAPTNEKKSVKRTRLQQPEKCYSLEDFRHDIRQTLDSQLNHDSSILVTSFSRPALHQTGDGHYSPIAAYHEASDHVLVLDVARFKYAPYWVSVEELYQAMEPLDEATQLPRGWYIMRPPLTAAHHHEMTKEDRRPAELVPEVYEGESCPVGKIKVQFCPAKDASSR